MYSHRNLRHHLFGSRLRFVASTLTVTILLCGTVLFSMARRWQRWLSEHAASTDIHGFQDAWGSRDNLQTKTDGVTMVSSLTSEESASSLWSHPLSDAHRSNSLTYASRRSYVRLLHDQAADKPYHYGACLPAPPGAIAWWPFHESDGPNRALDVVGGSHGQYAGNLHILPGRVDRGLGFPGNGSYLWIADSSLWDFGVHDFTIEFWIHLFIGTPSPQAVILLPVANIADALDFWSLQLHGAATQDSRFLLLFTTSTGAVEGVQLAHSPLNPGQWYHLAVTRSGNLYTGFVDGVPTAPVATSTTPIPDPAAPLTFGGYQGAAFFSGIIDEVTIYNRALTPLEVAQITDAGSFGKCLPPPHSLPAITSFSPPAAGNAGRVTIFLHGYPFYEGASVKLLRDGVDLAIAEEALVDSLSTMRAVFDLRTLIPGDASVQIENSDGSILTSDSAFQILDGGRLSLAVSLLGAANVRAGRTARFLAIVDNRSTIDSGLVRLDASISEGPASPEPPASSADSPDSAPNPLSQLTPLTSSPFTSIPSGHRQLVPIEVEIPAGYRDCPILTLNVKAIQPIPRKPPGCEEYDCEHLQEVRQMLFDQIMQLKVQISAIVLRMREENCDDPPMENIELCRQLSEELQILTLALHDLIRDLNWIDFLISYCCRAVHATATYASDAIRTPTRWHLEELSEAATHGFCSVTAWDPNEKEGIDQDTHIANRTVMPYTINFENLATASAPAQVVEIHDHLDANLDWASVSLGPVRFGSTEAVPPKDSRHFATAVDLRPSTNLIVMITADLDLETGSLDWILRSLDPNTGQPPQDPLIGFLPPNTAPPEGEGRVSFVVEPREGLATGTRISNDSAIVFDENPSIITNSVVNVIDADAPSSAISSLSIFQEQSTFLVEWSGTDIGSGLRDYDINVSIDGAPFIAWLQATTGNAALFSGQPGVSYSFYSVARDLAGNTEEAPVISDATTSVVASGLRLLSVSIEGSGSVTSLPSGIYCPVDCHEPYPENSSVTLSATPYAGASFVSWSGDGDCIDGVVEMNSSKVCAARFTDIASFLFADSFETGSLCQWSTNDAGAGDCLP